MRILLTGAGGFVGSAVRDAATRRGLLDLRAPLRPAVDILRPETLAPAMEGVDTVIHAAGAAHAFRRSAAVDERIYRTNVDGTRNVVVAACAAGVRHVVLVSSISVYGDLREFYARSKADAESAATEAAGAMTLTTLRLATTYGEGDPGNIRRLVRAIDRHRFVRIGRGANRKSLIHRDDAGEAIVAAAVAAGADGVFDVSAPPVTVSEIVTTIARELGRRVPRLPLSSGAAKFAAHAMTVLALRNPRIAAIERAVVKLLGDDVVDGTPFCVRFGFEPSVGLAEGIAREVAWYRGYT